VCESGIINKEEYSSYFGKPSSLNGMVSVVLQTSCAPWQRIWLYEWQTQAGIENVTMTGLSNPWLYWIPSSGIWWSVNCYKFAYDSEERAASFFGNCMQHDPTKHTQISTSLHGVLYQARMSYVVISAAW